MDSYHLEIDGLQIEILPKTIKNMYLRIYPPHAQIQVSVPQSFSLQQIRQQIKEKRKWIDKKRNHILSLPPLSQFTMEDGEQHYFLGNSYRLELISNPKYTEVEMRQDRLILYVKPMMTVSEKQKLLDSWYRQQLQNLLPPLISKWERIVGVQIQQYGIKRMKTRWGSCNIRSKRIWLNLELIKRSIECLESVIVHELVHLLERNHNDRFYGFMDTFMPEWRIYQKSLNSGTIQALY